ncbi:uncharacterized protein TNCV_3559541 [Trichonephila clavipes]|uniref:Uncharacterized protein n=1 Tax=Trichonephila clavipes TaxID=2585209 RepID=A0A8X7BHY8_TRICX|nr:uncharacterized protein TNCV_3559541 [Trichonephila clavipes]
MIPAYNSKRCAAFPFDTGINFRRKTDLFPEEDTTTSYSGFKPEPTRLQAKGQSHHTGWATKIVYHLPYLIASRVSPNTVYKLGGVVENIVRSQNYIGNHGRKAIGGAVRELASLADGNGRAAVRLYRERYLTRRQPNHQTFAWVHQNLVERGSFRATIEGTGRRRIARTPIFEEGVLHAVDQTPGTSVRALAAST